MDITLKITNTPFIEGEKFVLRTDPKLNLGRGIESNFIHLYPIVPPIILRPDWLQERFITIKDVNVDEVTMSSGRIITIKNRGVEKAKPLEELIRENNTDPNRNYFIFSGRDLEEGQREWVWDKPFNFLDVAAIPNDKKIRESINNANPQDDIIVFNDGGFEYWVRKILLRNWNNYQMRGDLATTVRNLINNAQERTIVFPGKEIFSSEREKRSLFLNHDGGQKVDAMDGILNRRQVWLNKDNLYFLAKKDYVRENYQQDLGFVSIGPRKITNQERVRNFLQNGATESTYQAINSIRGEIVVNLTTNQNNTNRPPNQTSPNANNITLQKISVRFCQKKKTPDSV